MTVDLLHLLCYNNSIVIDESGFVVVLVRAQAAPNDTNDKYSMFISDNRRE